MRLFSSRQGAKTTMQHRGMVICTIWTTVFLLASVVSGIPVEEGFLQINKGGTPFRTIFSIESNENLESDFSLKSDLHVLNILIGVGFLPNVN